MMRDLVVVGGGPVGVTMGLLAAHRGMAVVVLEREREIYNKARAIGMDGEIQLMLHGVGLGERIAAITTPMGGAEFLRPDGEQIMGMAMPAAENSPFGFSVMASHYQPQLEAELRAAAVERGAEIWTGAEVRGVDGDSSVVRTRVTRAHGSEVIEEVLESRWVVAADGASSGVRKSLGISFEDLGFDQEWLVVDVRLHDGVEAGDGAAEQEFSTFAQQICDPERPATVVPGHGPYRRWEFQLQPDDVVDEMTQDDTVWRLLAPWLRPEQAVVERAVVYRFHATVAEQMRAGRVFLAGDSGHQMPPFLGQGLNSGMRDAANLVWKLDAVRRGDAGDQLLDSYDAERRPHVSDMAAYACDTGRLIDQFAGRTDDGVAEDAAYGGSRPFPFLRNGVLAGDHPMTGRLLFQARIAGRLLDDLLGAEWTLLCRDASAIPSGVAESWGGLGGVVVLGDEWERMPFAPTDGVVFVRPDRYVAAVAEDRDSVGGLSAELLAWFA